jgi:hypothetical protein
MKPNSSLPGGVKCDSAVVCSLSNSFDIAFSTSSTMLQDSFAILDVRKQEQFFRWLFLLGSNFGPIGLL